MRPCQSAYIVPAAASRPGCGSAPPAPPPAPGEPRREGQSGKRGRGLPVGRELPGVEYSRGAASPASVSPRDAGPW